MLLEIKVKTIFTNTIDDTPGINIMHHEDEDKLDAEDNDTNTSDVEEGNSSSNIDVQKLDDSVVIAVQYSYPNSVYLLRENSPIISSVKQGQKKYYTYIPLQSEIEETINICYTTISGNFGMLGSY